MRPEHATISLAHLAGKRILPGMGKPRFNEKRPNRPWYVDHIDPVTNRRTTKTFLTESDAWQFYANNEALREKLRIGSITPREVAVLMKSAVPPKTALDGYEQWMVARKLTAKHIATARRVIERAIDGAKWNDLTQIDEASLRVWLAQFSPATVNAYTRLVKSFTAWLVDSDQLPHDPLARMKRVRQSAVRIKRAMTQDEYHSLIACPDIEPWRRLWYFVAGRTGLRKTEMGRLCWRHVDLDNAMLHIPPEVGKVNREDTVPLTGALVGELRQVQQAPLAKVFRHSVDRRVFHNDLRRAGVAVDTDAGRLNLSSLRKTFGTHLAAAGYDTQTRQDLMRHSDPKLTTRTYVDSSQIATRQAIDNLDNPQEQTA